MSAAQGIMSEKMFTELARLKERQNLTQKQQWRHDDLQYRLDTYDPKSISSNCKDYLIMLYSYLKYGKRYYVKGEQPFHLIKGTSTEKPATELVQRVTGQKLFRNKKQMSNDYVKGALDVTDRPDIKDSKLVVEIKNSYNLINFLQTANHPLPNNIYFQMQGYFALTGKDKGVVYNCLVDSPDHLIKKEYDSLFQKLCPYGEATDFFKEEWAKMEAGFRFEDIPEEERVIPFPVERDEKIIELMYEKIELCREWLAEFEQVHKKKTYGIILES
jgi:hypothetical protein